MLSPSSFDKIYLYRPFVDFRRGINGLTILIQDEMQLNPFESALFIFCSRSKNRIKAIYWDKTGFAMFYKILEKEKYRWPVHFEDKNISVDMQNLKQFLSGLNPWQVPHKELHYKKV